MSETRNVIFQVTEIKGAMNNHIVSVKVEPQDLFYMAETEGEMVDGKFVVDDETLKHLITKVRDIAYIEFTDE